MNILKYFIPTGNTKKISEIESYLVTWYTNAGWYGAKERHDKVIINKVEVEELKVQLEKAAKFLQTPVRVEITKN